MVRLVQPRAHEQQQRRHQQKHRQHAEQNGLHQHQAHVRTDLDLHKRQREQTGNGRQAGGGNFGDCNGQRLDDGVARRVVRTFLGIVVAEDDGVVDRQTELQHCRNGVRDERDFAEPIVRALIDPYGNAECDQQDRHLGVGLAREQQDEYDDHNQNDEHHLHLFFQNLARRVADLGHDIGVIVAQRVSHVLNALNAHVVQLFAVEHNLKQCRRRIVVVLIVLQRDGLDAVHGTEHFSQFLGLRICNVRHHHARVAVGEKFAVHDLQTLPCFRVVRQIIRQVLVDIHAVGGKDRKNAQRHEQHHKQVAPVHDECRNALHERFFHIQPLLRQPPRKSAPEAPTPSRRSSRQSSFHAYAYVRCASILLP